MDLIIGNEDCEFITVCDAMTKSVAATRLYKNWLNLARHLHVPSDEIFAVRQQLRSGGSVNTAIFDILQAWRAKFSERANLNKLIAVLEKCDLNELADALRREFNYHNGEISPRRFAQRSSSRSMFVYPADMTLIVSTPEPLVTYNKFLEAPQISISQLLSEEEYLLSQVRVHKHQRTVILSSEPEKFLDKCKSFKNKVTILTKQTKDTLKQKLKNLRNVKIKRDHLKWNDLSPSFQLEIRNSCDILKRIDDDSLQSILNDDLLFELLQNLKQENFLETIPKFVPYYIPRTIILRHYISDKFFDIPIPDNVFVFTGFQPHELSSSLKKCLTDVSTRQLAQDELSVSYILLDNTSDFELIANKTDKPVHWLHRENCELIWKRSIRSITVIQQNIEKQKLCTEAEFVQNLDATNQNCKNETVCISDKPGMGKSMLLGNIARRLSEENKIVMFIEISEFLKVMKSSGSSSEPCKHILAESICSLTTCSPFGKNVMRALLESKVIKVEILFDGVDEIQAQELQFVFECLRQISKSFPLLRLWVTTRPNLLKQVENELNVLGYNISPFGYEEQLKFLIEFWRFSKPKLKLDEIKLGAFATACLKALTDIGNTTQEDFAGMPLQCFLIAKVYSEAAIKYSQHDTIVSGNTFPVISLESIASLFDTMVNNSFRTYFTNYKKPGLPITHVDLINAHVYKAMDLLFPEWLPKLKKYFAFTHLLTDIENVGIVGYFGSKKELTFIHRTFAEYFLGKLTTSLLKHQEDSNVMQFCYKTVFKNTAFRSHIRGYGQNNLCKTVVATFDHKVICFFIENMIDGNMKLKMNIDNDSERAVQRLQVRELSIACAYHSYFKLFTALNETNAFQLYQSEIFDRNMLFITTAFSNSTFVDIVLDKFNQITKILLNTVMENEYVNLLHVAVQRGEYRVFDLLFKKHGFNHWVNNTPRTLLIHTCIEHSKHNSMEVIEDKLQIIRALFHSKEVIVEETDTENHTAILCRDVHVRLLIELVKKSNLFALRLDSETFLHNAACYMLVDDFKELILAIPKPSLKKLLSIRGDMRRTPLHTLVNSLDPDSELLDLFAEFGADFNAVDDYKSTILSVAIENGCKNLDAIVKHGADLQHTNRNGDTLLHIAVKVGNLHAVKFLLEKGTDINARNFNYETPFHFVAHHESACMTELVEIFIQHGVNLNACNEFGETALHYVLKNPFLDAVKFAYTFKAFENLLTDINYFYYGVEESPIETVQFITEYYCNLFSEGSLPFLDFGPDKPSLLHAAVTNKHSSHIVEYFLEFQLFKDYLCLPKMRDLVNKVSHLIASCDKKSGRIEKIKTFKILLWYDPTLLHEPDDERIGNTKFV